jgi:hypothetical protein
MEDRRADWRDLCAAIAVEKDPEKLLALSKQLLDILDARSRRVVARSNGESSDGTYENVEGGFIGQEEG